MTYERIEWRPLGYEIFVLVNFGLIYLLTAPNTNAVLETLPSVMAQMSVSLLLQICAGVVIRLIVGAIRGGWREYLAVIRKPAWIVETVRMLIIGALVVHVYCWIKTALPLLHPRLFDQELWDFDRAIFFGISPNIFALNLFSNHTLLRFVDATYGNIFVASVFIAFAYFLSAPSRRLRIAFVTTNAAMWIIGAWLYMALPSLGPAYRFPDVWFQYSADFVRTQQLQALLWKNYAEVIKLRLPGGRPGNVNIILGIAAFPSMHVAFQTFVFLWFRRLWTWGQVTFALFAFVIFLGSLLTGWHYLIDSLAGLLLAWAAWTLASRKFRIARWAHLRRVL